MNKKEPWWKNCVAYQIYPRSFNDSNGDGIGDINGIREKLDYLAYLGIDLIWICPIYDSPNDDNGYDIRDYQKIQKEYGTMEEFDLLLAEAHEKGIRVIMDLVINHTSDEHQWFVESRSSVEHPKRDWYIWKDGKDGGAEPNNWESIFGGSAWEYDEATEQYFLHLFSRKMPDINWENEDAKEEVFRMVRWWLDKGIDGFRVDAISHIKKGDLSDMPNPKGLKHVPSFGKNMNQPGIHKLLGELKKNVFDRYDIFTIAEASGVSHKEMKEWISTDEGKFSSVFQFEHQHLWDDEGTDRFSVKKFREALSKWQHAIEHDGWVALFLENHDLVRSINKFGNADRYREESAKCLALAYFMQKGIPFLYQGQEIGMVNADYSDACDFRDLPFLEKYEEKIAQGCTGEEAFEILKSTTRDNSRTPMQWDSSVNGGFSEAEPWMKVNRNYREINVEAQMKDDDSILNFYRRMIELKKNDDILTYGSFRLIFEEKRSIFAYERFDRKGNHKYIICCNLSDRNQKLKAEHLLADADVMLHNYKEFQGDVLRPYEAFMVKVPLS